MHIKPQPTGIGGPHEARSALDLDVAGQRIHGVMVGRAAFNQPWHALSPVDTLVFGEATNPATSRRQVLVDYCKYADAIQGRWREDENGYQVPSLRVLAKPILNLFAGDRGNKAFKQAIDAQLKNSKCMSELIEK